MCGWLGLERQLLLLSTPSLSIVRNYDYAYVQDAADWTNTLCLYWEKQGGLPMWSLVLSVSLCQITLRGSTLEGLTECGLATNFLDGTLKPSTPDFSYFKMFWKFHFHRISVARLKYWLYLEWLEKLILSQEAMSPLWWWLLKGGFGRDTSLLFQRFAVRKVWKVDEILSPVILFLNVLGSEKMRDQTGTLQRKKKKEELLVPKRVE